MFKRLQFAQWQEILPVISFIISFLLFLVIVIYMLRMRKEKIEHLSNLPLNTEKPSPENDEYGK